MYSVLLLLLLSGVSLAATTILSEGESLSDAIAATSGGDTLELSSGTYDAPATIEHSLTIQAAVGADVTLFAASGIAIGADLSIAGVTITGGDGASAALRSTGASLSLIDVVIEDYSGDGLSVTDGVLLIEGGRLSPDGATARLVDTDARLDGVVVQGIVPGLAPSYLFFVSGGELSLVHTTVAGAYRGCLKAYGGAHLSLSGSILAGCGVMYGQGEGESMAHYAVVLTEATGEATHSLINPSPMRPHEYGIYGDMVMGEGILWGAYPGYAGWSDRVAVLAVTVDDQSRFDNAVDIAAVMGDRGLHMSYFINLQNDWSLTDDEWATLRAMVAEGHDIGTHCATNARLVQEEPLFVSWGGAGSSDVLVSSEATALSVQVNGEPVLSLDLTDTESNTMMEVCAQIDALSDHACWINDEFVNGAAYYVVAAALADGETPLSAVGAGILYDNRLPSEGGRRFTFELMLPLGIISAGIGGGYEVISMGYPGQEHDALVRDAVEEVGIHIARGAGSYSTGDHLLHTGFDRLQSPINIGSDLLLGPDHDDLTDAEQQERIRQFVASWSSMALEYGAMGAVTIHGAEHFSPEQVGWLLDALAETDVQVLSMRELSAMLDEEVGTDRFVALPALPPHDYSLSASSPAVDAGVPGSRSTDASGRPIYGAPDLGALEHQPEHTAAGAPLAVGLSARIYADGALRLWGDGGAPVLLSLAPVNGYVVHSPTEPRAALLDLELADWQPDAPAWTATAAEAGEWCVQVGGLAPGGWTVSTDGLVEGSVTVSDDGTASFLLSLAEEQAMSAAMSAGGGAPPLPACVEVVVAADTADTAERARTSAGCASVVGRGGLLAWVLGAGLISSRRGAGRSRLRDRGRRGSG
ncbi:MAG: hypothetical protein ACI8S6_001677 [Myxococcota bacterium]